MIRPYKKSDGGFSYSVYVNNVSYGTFTRKTDAKRVEAEVIRRRQLGEHEELVTGRRRITVDEVVEEWHRSRRGDESSRAFDKWAVRRLSVLLGAKPVRNVTADDCERIVSQCATDGLGVKSTNHAIKATRSVFSFAHRRGYVRLSPAGELKRVRERANVEERVRVLTPEDHQQLVAEFDAHWQPLIRVWPFIGLRISEVFGLQWKNLDLSTGKLRVRMQAPKRVVDGLQPLKTSASCRVIDLAPDTIRVLKEWRLACPPSSFGLVFPSKRGGLVNPHTFRGRYWKDAKEKAGLPDITPHDMRHTFVSLLIDAGRSIKEVQYLAGHGSSKVTLDTYAHLLAERESMLPLSASDWYSANTRQEEELSQAEGLK